MSKALVMVVDDEASMITLLEYNLKKAGYDVVSFENAEDATLYLDEGKLPDVCVVDWMLPGMSGVDLVKVMRDYPRSASVPIILLTCKGELEDKEEGFGAGADDYLTKPFEIAELKARIYALLRRVSPQKTSIEVNLGDLSLVPDKRLASLGGKSVEFGPTEFNLLHFFATHPSRVYSRRQLLDATWGDHVCIEERTVDVHVRRIRLALQKLGKAEMLETVRGMGYRLNPDA